MNLSVKTYQGFAPGRLDVMGGIADYSGSLVLQMPISNQTSVEFTPREDYQCNFVSQCLGEPLLKATINYNELLVDHKVDYGFVRNKLNANEAQAWIAYVIGCALVLQQEKGLKFTGGDFSIQSNVPLGKGVSSSASIEVATMKALQAAYQLSFETTELPTLAQKAENLIAGAPCGLMDQLASYFGKSNHLLPIICQPDIIHKPIPIYDGIHFIGIDSGIRHAVSGASYSDVRCAAFMGYSIIAQYKGVTVKAIEEAIQQKDFNALPYKGYLCNITTDEWNSELKYRVPEKISGRDFINRYQLSTDLITTIEADKIYFTQQCSQHPVFENERVKKFKELTESITSLNKLQSLTSLGELMYQSHVSYSACGLGNIRTDEIVSLASKEKGIYGAKITGGGNGGTVCLLADDTGMASAKAMHQKLQERYNASLAYFLN